MDIAITVEKKKPSDLKKFESINWPIADKEHYGNANLDFTRKNYYITARHNQKLLGFALVQTDAGVMSIEDLLVSYNNQREGVGTKLLAALEDLAIEKKCHVIELITGEDWNARILYKKNGYKLLCKLPDYYVHRDFVLMVKRLNSKE